MAQKINVDALTDMVMKNLTDYADLTSQTVKQAVKKAGKTVKEEISAGAPSATGRYAKSWSVKTMKETSDSLEVTVHSKNRYQLAHLLEHGHAKRGGGRVAARVHIAPAEESGVRQLEEEIERGIRNG
ncbi:MAG: HK97 gp10 family phage protein [Eubacteriales bacterium]|nr:HK97 gp10 family phage protein [Eubacteriales bacterium]